MYLQRKSTHHIDTGFKENSKDDLIRFVFRSLSVHKLATLMATHTSPPPPHSTPSPPSPEYHWPSPTCIWPFP